MNEEHNLLLEDRFLLMSNRMSDDPESTESFNGDPKGKSAPKLAIKELVGDITVEEEAETRFIADSSKGAKTEATGKATFSCGTPAVSDGTATSFLTDETLVDAGGTTTLTAGTQVVADEKAWLFTGGRSLTVGLDRTTFLGGSNVTGSSSNPYKFTKD